MTVCTWAGAAFVRWLIVPPLWTLWTLPAHRTNPLNLPSVEHWLKEKALCRAFRWSLQIELLIWCCICKQAYLCICEVLHFYQTHVWSLPRLVTPSLSALIEFCLNWICQSCYMHFFKLSDGFVKNVIWISLSFSWICLNWYMDFCSLVIACIRQNWCVDFS